VRAPAPTKGPLHRAAHFAASLGVGLGLGLVLAPTASAKFCAVIDAPARAHSGQTITVRALTLADGAWVDGKLVQRRPGVPLPHRIAITVVDPSGSARTVVLERSPRPDVQRARLALDRPGAWELRLKGRYGACAAGQRVRVV
jgi:hypothetical protein